MQLSPRLEAYLRSWFITSTDNKRAKGATVNLTWDQFLALFTTKQLRKLEADIDAKCIRYRQAADEPKALVLTWRSYAAVSSGVFNADTAIICTRQQSAMINRVLPGSKLRPAHAANIGARLKGKPKSDEHKQAISASCKGQPKAPWSRERKLARQALLAFKRDQGVKSCRSPNG